MLYKNGVSYEHMPSGIDDITIIMDESNLTPEIERSIMTELQEAIHPDEMHIIHNYAIVMVVGEGMRNTVGLMARATQSLANAGVTLQMINQGASELSIMFGVSQDDADKAVQALHKEFFKLG